MTEEIKEILDRLECDKDDIYYIGFVDGINVDNTFLPKDIKLLLNYITNLQEENCKLKETNEEHRKINGQLQEENNMLKKELKNKPDCEWTLETKDGQIMTIIQSERIDMQEKLNKSNQKLFKENQKLFKVIDELEKSINKEIERTNNLILEDGCMVEINNIRRMLNDDRRCWLYKLTELKGGSDNA